MVELALEIEMQLLANAHAAGTTADEYVARLLRGKAALLQGGSPNVAAAPKRTSAFEKYAHVMGGSDDFAKLKQAEIDLEDSARWCIIPLTPDR